MSVDMRQTAQRYVPPSRRSAGGPAETEQRVLEGAGPALSQVRLVLLQEGFTFDHSSCPLDIEAQCSDNSRGASASQAEHVCSRDAGGSGEGSPGPSDSHGGTGSSSGAGGSSTSSFLIFFPERLPSELLRWFGDTFPGGAARLEFPPSLSKGERATWHHAADRVHLHGQSVGVGDGRFLTIGKAPSHATPAGTDARQRDGGGGSSGSGSARLTREQYERAKFIYNCAQMEGGRHWERSRGEVEALVVSGQPLPPDLQELVDRRLQGLEVHRLLKAGQPSEALCLLSEEPKLAWVKDEDTGGYPIHVAAWKGYESVVLFLASLPGVLEQRDGRRDTALAVARRRRQAAVEELLLEAGAKPEQATFAQEADGPADVQEEEYCSWSAQERLRYRHGGSGGPPGLPARGGRGRAAGGGGRGGGRAWGRGPGRGRGGAPREEQEQSRCPW